MPSLGLLVRFVHGAETSYHYDENSECHVLEVWPRSFDEPDHHDRNGHEEAEGDILFELAEFDFTELVKAVTNQDLSSRAWQTDS